MVGDALKWKKILSEYSESRNDVKKYCDHIKNNENVFETSELEISRDIYSELSNNIRYVKKNYLTELKVFLSSKESSILTEKQHYIMSMRAKGYSMSRIAEILNVSKTAVFKSIKLSEKKIEKITI